MVLLGDPWNMLRLKINPHETIHLTDCLRLADRNKSQYIFNFRRLE